MPSLSRSQILALPYLLSADLEQPPFVLALLAFRPVEVPRLFFLALISSVFVVLPLEQGVRRPVLLPVACVLQTRMPRKLSYHLHAIYMRN